jgi:hypothetical protein
METIISDLLGRFEKGSLSRRDLVRGLAMLAASGTVASAQDRGHRPRQHSGCGPAALHRFLSKDVRFLGGQRGQAAPNRSAGQHTNAGVSQPRKPGRHRRSFRDRDSPIHQGGCGELCETARRDTAGRSLRRLAREGSRWNQRADLQSEMTGAKHARRSLGIRTRTRLHRESNRSLFATPVPAGPPMTHAISVAAAPRSSGTPASWL